MRQKKRQIAFINLQPRLAISGTLTQRCPTRRNRELAMRRIIYISRSLVDGDPDAIAGIVAGSVAWNTTAGITGMLWSDGASFAQVIEGASDQIELTMERIRRDPSHTDITVLLDRSILSRQFGNWSMRCAGDDEASAHGTSFMIGFAMGERTAASKRLYEIVLSSHAGNVG